MEADQNGESTIVQGTVSANNNDEDIQLSVMEGNFEISLNRLNWAQSLTLDASGEVFYVRLANTSNAGEFYGSLSATTSIASAYADLQGTVHEKSILYGDVNMDGMVTSADVTAVYNYLINNDSHYRFSADVNGDGIISIEDINAIYNYLLN